MSYHDFINAKSQIGGMAGFEPLWMPKEAFDFQRHLATWNLMKGKSADFADCGMGKTFIELIFAQNVVMKTNGRVLILTPLAVSYQTEREAEKFGIEAKVCRDGKLASKIVITNYERLHYFNAEDFEGVVCDESSAIKNFDGQTTAAITEFMRRIKYRLLGTATAAPNDYIELGTSSEALGEMGYMDMLGMFFKNAQNSLHPSMRGAGARVKSLEATAKFRFRGHAEQQFWRWVCSWARACRKPSDLGFDDGKFKLPDLKTRQHIVSSRSNPDGFLFPLPAHGLKEQGDELRRTVNERCEMVAELVQSHQGPSIAWCNRNEEGDLLQKLIPGAAQVAGKDSDEKKEELLTAFAQGKIGTLISKPVIAGLGLNFQVCAHQTYFPSHSYEQWHQCVRRSWRFGQKREVTIDVVTTEGQADVLSNLMRKQRQAEEMFTKLVSLMGNELRITQENRFTKTQQLPSFLCQ